MKENNLSFLRSELSLLLPLGAGFVMASSADVRAAIGMGCAVTVVLLLSSLVICALRNVIPNWGHVPAYLLIITGFVSLVQMLMEAYFPNVVNMLGVHLAALAVSAVPFRSAETVSCKSPVGKAVVAALCAGLSFLVIMLVCAVIREPLGSASFCGMNVAFLNDYKVSSLVGAFGGYLALSIVLAAFAAIGNKLHKNEVKGEA